MAGTTSRQLEFNGRIKMFDGQVITGGVVSTIVTVWLQLVVEPQPSVIVQFFVANFGQVPLVEMLVVVTKILVVVPATLLVQQVVTVGVLNVQVLPHCTVLLVGQMTCRQLVGQHRTVTVWLQFVLLPHPSMMLQLWVTKSCGHAPLVTMPVEVTSTLVSVPEEV